MQLDTITQYFNDVNKTEMLKTREEEYALITKAQAGDIEARNRIITANLKLVISIAKKYQNSSVPFSELIQEGNIGMFRAIEKFDTSSGNKFSTYASWWIRQNITRYISTTSRTVRIPIKLSELVSKYRKALATLEKDLVRQPTLEEISIYLNIEIDVLQNMLQANLIPLSFESPMDKGEESNSTVADFIEDTTKPTDYLVERNEAVKQLYFALDQLTDKEKYVIMQLNGFSNSAEKRVTKTQVADKIGVKTTAQVNKIEREAKNKLRRIIGDNPLTQ